jgi:general secretion pathway protein I
MSGRSRQRGFSLLEVVAAVLLLAITFASLMRVAGSSLNLTARSAERSQAALWARSLLDSAFVLEPIRTGRRSGRFDARYSWQMNVQPFQLPASAPLPGAQPQPQAPASPLRLYRLDLDVLWQSAGHAYSARFSTLRAGGPPAPGSAS